MFDEIIVRFKDAVGEPVVAHELPDVFDRVEFGTFRRQGNNGDVGRHEEARRQVPASLIDQEDGVGTRRNGFGDLREMQVHRLGIAGREDQGRALAIFGTDGAEDVGRGGTLITRRAGTRAALCPPAGDFVLLADTRLVGEPDFYPAAIDRLLTCDGIHARKEAFLKSSIAPAGWA